MWNYEKRLEYPVNITQKNPAIAKAIISQYGGPYSIPCDLPPPLKIKAFTILRTDRTLIQKFPC